MIKAIVHLPSGEFRSKNGGLDCGPNEPQRPVLSVVDGVTTYDPDYDVVVVSAIPNPRTQKWNGSAVVTKTAQEITNYNTAEKTASFTATSRQKDILATCALIVRARGIAAWKNMTIDEKRTATLAEADVWVGIRQFIEDNV